MYFPCTGPNVFITTFVWFQIFLNILLFYYSFFIIIIINFTNFSTILTVSIIQEIAIRALFDISFSYWVTRVSKQGKSITVFFEQYKCIFSLNFVFLIKYRLVYNGT